MLYCGHLENLSRKMANENNHPLILKTIQEKSAPIVKVYEKRWIILIIYILYSAISTFQWIEYSIITNIVVRYYDVSASAVDWTGMVFMVMWPTFVFPASFIIDKMGLRVAGLIGCLSTALGTAIKIFSVERNMFWVVVVGQTIVAISQIFILSLPPKISVTWFKPSEVSTVCALGVFGMQFGGAMGFLVPPIVVKNHERLVDIGSNFKMLCWGLTAAIIPVTLAVILYFPKQPKHPPSQLQLAKRENKEVVTSEVFIGSIKTLLKNQAFVLHTVCYSISVGVFSAIGTLFNQFILNYFEDAQEDAGRMGLMMISIGMIGSITAGFVLDKTHRYKETAFIIFLLSALSIGGFLFALEMRSKWMVYLAISVFGFFMNAYMPAGIEFATEMTFPSPESTVAGIPMAMSQILGVLFTLAISQVNEKLGTFWSLIGLAGILVVGTVLTGLTPNKLRRQEAFSKEAYVQNRRCEVVRSMDKDSLVVELNY